MDDMESRVAQVKSHHEDAMFDEEILQNRYIGISPSFEVIRRQNASDSDGLDVYFAASNLVLVRNLSVVGSPQKDL